MSFRQRLANRGTTLKRSRPAASPTHETICLRTEKRVRRPSQSPAHMWEPASPSPQSSTDLMSPETTCPLCGGKWLCVYIWKCVALCSIAYLMVQSALFLLVDNHFLVKHLNLFFFVHAVSFSPAYLPLHASTCMDSDSAEFSGVVETAGGTSRRSSPVFGSGTDEVMVPCPLCSVRFPPDRIQRHASTCGDTAESSVVWLDWMKRTVVAFSEDVAKNGFRWLMNLED